MRAAGMPLNFSVFLPLFSLDRPFFFCYLRLPTGVEGKEGSKPSPPGWPIFCEPPTPSGDGGKG